MALLTVTELASRLTVSPRTVMRYVKSGTLKSVRLPGGGVRVEEDELLRFTGRSDGTSEARDQLVSPSLSQFISGETYLPRGEARCVTVFDWACESSAQALELAQLASRKALGIAAEPSGFSAAEGRFEFAFLQKEHRARVVLWGKPQWQADVLHALAVSGLGHACAWACVTAPRACVCGSV